MKYYRDYYWNEGRPTGINAINNCDDPLLTTYKLISDPYHKWISIEKYIGRDFDSVVYDSSLFDFRSLKPVNQTAWKKEPFGSSTDTAIIRDHDDRVILFEEYSFAGNNCRMCRTRSAHGVPISTQRIFYEDLGDKFNGVALFDNEEHIVMYKLYSLDPSSKEFSEVIEEKWNMKNQDLEQWQLSPLKKKK